MKRLIAAVAVSALLAAPAFAVDPDTDNLVYKLKGEVASTCTLTPDGPISVNVNMANTGNQGLAGIAYGCNSPFKLTIESKNGGMQHQESNGAINLDYDIETLGFTTGSGLSAGVFRASQMKGAANAKILAQATAWNSLNVGAQAGSLDMRPITNPGHVNLAGTYEDEVTVTLTATL